MTGFLLVTSTESNKSYCDGIWIGLNDVAKDGVWEWESDSCESTFRSWATGEPNNWGGSEEYVGIPLWTDEGWNDYGNWEGLVCGCQQTADACGAGWIEDNNGNCYNISENLMGWSDCSQRCEQIGADMLCVENQEQNDFILDNIGCAYWSDHCGDSCCDGMWIGYYEDLVEDWTWNWGSCDSDFINWDDGQPDDSDGGESTAVIGHWSRDGTWHDVPGMDTGDWDGAVCACQKNGSSSCPDGWLSYTGTDNCYYISVDTMTYVECMATCDNLEDSHMITCIQDQNENDFLYDNIGCSPDWPEEEDCAWEHSILIEDGLWLGVGMPCFVVILIVFSHMSGIVTLGLGVKLVSNVGNVNLEPDANAGTTTSKSAYGRLIDTGPEDVESTTVDSLMNRWILLGALGEIGHAFALLALGVTMSMHMNDVDISIYIDAFEAFIGCLCKILIGTCAWVVHKKMSLISRKIAGPWVKIFSLFKLLAAGTWLVLMLVFVSLGNEWDKNFCIAGFLFFCVMLATTILQTMTGFALYRIHVRAAKKLRNNSIFYEIVGCWWAALVIGQFGVGICFWMIGAGFFVLHNDGFEAMGFLYLLSSAFQVVTGVSMLFIDRKVRAFYSSSEGANAIQMMQQNSEL